MSKTNVKIITPQFKRTGKLKKEYTPKNKADLNRIISDCTHKQLTNMGCGVWEKTKEHTHYLYPGEWYNHIPEDFEIVSISGKTSKFKKGKSDDDIRFGCLPYGFLRKNK